MVDDQDASSDDEERSFRERVEALREERAAGDGDPREAMMGGGPPGPGGMGGMGGNPFAAMMGGMMGGGPGGMGGPGGPGGADTEHLAHELQQLREQVRDATAALERIADALEDD